MPSFLLLQGKEFQILQEQLVYSESNKIPAQL